MKNCSALECFVTELLGGKRTFASGKMLGLELVSLWRKRAFASGKTLGLESGICCARTFFGETTASKNISARDFWREGGLGGRERWLAERCLALYLEFVSLGVFSVKRLHQKTAQLGIFGEGAG